ncbi:MAG TPA: diguanylate cyclase, partial [Spirillospora sp.]|nr:diguanylate cyclase [Spirillospora sp.]
AVVLAAGSARLELLALVRARPALDDVPVLLLAPAGIRGQEVASALRAGANDVVTGAVEADELRARIGRAVALAAETREVRRDAEAAAAALDAAPFPTALLGPDGTIVRAGASFCALTGRPPEELRGLTLDALSHPDDAGTEARERRFVRPDGRVVPLLLHEAAVGGAGGAPHAAVVQAHDLTAERDELTLLQRRHRFEEAVAAQAAGGGGARARFAVVVCGIDGMHQVNRAHGRRRGDRLLRGVADAMRRRLGGPEHLARAGGDSFAVLLPGAGEREARAFADELLELAAAVRVPGRPSLRPVASAGAALVARGGRGSAALAAAEDALSRARRRGGGRVVVARG